LKFDRFTYTNDVVEWDATTANATGYSATVTSGEGAGNVWLSSGNLVSYNNELYLPVTASAGETTFDASQYEKLNAGNVLINTNNRIMGYYQPGVGMPGKDLNQLVRGLEYSGVTVTGNAYANTSVYDTTITSSYIDTDLGTRPEDINVDGGAYVDSHSSHAPEEMLPGRVYDTLDLKVLTAYTSAFDTSGFYLGRVLVTDPGYGYSMDDIQITAVGVPNSYLVPTLNATGGIESIEIRDIGIGLTENINPVITITGGNILQASASGFITQSQYPLLGYRVFNDMNGRLEYTSMSVTTTLAEDLNLTDTTITVTDASVLQEPSVELARPGVVFINGERITYYTRDTALNTLGQLRRGVHGTGAPLVHAAGSTVTESSLAQRIPDTTSTMTELIATDGVSDTFTCTSLSCNVASYVNSISVSINNIDKDFILEQVTPVIVVKLLEVPPAGTFVTISTEVEHVWLNVAANNSGNLFITSENDNIITNTGFTLALPTMSDDIIVDGTGLIGSVTPQARFLKGQV